MGDDQTPEAVVRRQIVAYNAHDLDAFLATYAEDVEIIRPDGETSVGRESMSGRYAEQFAIGLCHAEITARICQGEWVVDHETAHGLGAEPVRVIVAYRVRDGLIHQVRFFA